MSFMSKICTKRLLRAFNRDLSASSVGFYKIPNNTIMTTPSDRAKEAVDALKGNPYLEKYAKKIAELQKTSPEELLSRIDAFEKLKEDNPTVKTPLEKEREFSTPLNAKSDQVAALTKPKKLDDVMKTDLIEGKSSDEIKQLWEEYYKHKDVIAATIPADIYDNILECSSKHPTFLLALPRSKGYEFIVCQFSGNEIHFTPLISYQTHKENAPECLTITHYIELKDDKKLVLMKGEFNKDIMNATEAQCLANQVQLYYGQNDKKRLQILDCFTNRPLEFKHMDLIAELECLSI